MSRTLIFDRGHQPGQEPRAVVDATPDRVCHLSEEERQARLDAERLASRLRLLAPAQRAAVALLLDLYDPAIGQGSY